MIQVAGKKLFLVLTMTLVVALFTFAATYPAASEYGPGIVNWGPNVKSGGTLVLAEGQGTEMPSNLNPLSPFPLQVTPLIYEPLFYVNTANGEVTDLLGTNYKWTDNNLELVITTRSNVKWSDGKSFSASDVAFTFNLLKTYPALDRSGIWSKVSGLQSVEASGTNTVIFNFSKPNVPQFYYIAMQPIVPEHIWKDIKNPATYTNPNPVGTGAFLFESYTPSNGNEVVVKNPNYWMTGRPYIDELVIKSLLTNQSAFLELLKGDAQWGEFYAPDPQTTWIAKDPEHNKIWWPAEGSNALFFNTQIYPFNSATFRKAIDLAINKKNLEDKAYFGAGGYNVNPTAIIPSQQSEWLDPTLTALASSLNTYNPAEAQKMLASIGFVKNSSGQLVGPDGKVLPPLKLSVVSGWTDFITMADVMSSELQSIGFNVVVDQETYNSFISSLMSGTYQMALWGLNGPAPYYIYYSNFNPTLSATKIGETAISDYTRYTNPLITAALSTYAQTTNLSLQKQAMYTIERIVLEEMPFVTLTNSTGFQFFNTKEFTGFPSNDNIYSASGSLEPGSYDGYIEALNIHLK
jgi:peptide/nickel transport system substrate-binding protein